MADNSSSSGQSDEDQESSEGRGRRRDRHQPLRQINRSQSPSHNRPNMSDQRIGLLGTSMSENSRVGNLILNNDVFGKITPIPEVEEHSERVEDRNITVISTDLLRSNLTQEAVKQKAVELSKYNFHVIILVLQHNEFTHFHKNQSSIVLMYFGEQTMKHTMILTTDDKDSSDQSVKENKLIQQLSARCGGGRLQLLHTQRSQILQKVDTLSSGWVPDIPRTFRRIFLLGQSGVGKSAAGNTILRRKEFRAELRMGPVTRQCSVAHTRYQGRFVSVIDTPGLFDTQMNREEFIEEIARGVDFSSPGAHAFLIVFPVNMRFNEQEQQIPQMIERIFGQDVLNYCIILFTHGDQLDGESVEKLIKQNSRLRSVVQQCGGRYHVFNNRDVNNREQVEDLLQKIDSMIQQNGGGHYSNQMYEEIQRLRQIENAERRNGDGGDGGGFIAFFSNNWGYFATAAFSIGLGVIGGGPAKVALVAVIGAAITAIHSARNAVDQRR